MTMASVAQLTAMLTAIATAMVAGLLFAFSCFVMRALSRLSTGEGVRAMQSINVAILRPCFLALFLGPVLSSAALLAAVAAGIVEAELLPIAAGGGLYLAGVIGVTRLFNIPRNDRLAAVDADSAEAEPIWAEYLSRWVFWNHVRTVAAVAATVALLYS